MFNLWPYLLGSNSLLIYLYISLQSGLWGLTDCAAPSRSHSLPLQNCKNITGRWKGDCRAWVTTWLIDSSREVVTLWTKIRFKEQTMWHRPIVIFQDVSVRFVSTEKKCLWLLHFIRYLHTICMIFLMDQGWSNCNRNSICFQVYTFGFKALSFLFPKQRQSSENNF